MVAGEDIRGEFREEVGFWSVPYTHICSMQEAAEPDAILRNCDGYVNYMSTKILKNSLWLKKEFID